MNRKMKYLLLLPLTTIVSCGYSSSYLVEGNKYTSAKFSENYYIHWDNELKSAHKNEVIDVTNEALITGINYSYFADNTITGLGEIDPNYFEADPGLEEFANDFKMNSVDDSFNYGYQSKLFDGQMVCGGQNGRPEYAYQLGRVQINRNGFSIRFSKESTDLHYFALNFKASTDNTKKCYPVDGTTLATTDTQLFHNSKINLTITLYNKTLNGIEGYPFSMDVEFDNKHTNDGHYYTFIAFDLEDYELSRLVGVSLEFTVLEDALISYNEGKTYIEGGETKNVDLTIDDYALFLYELFFPYTSWN